MKMKNIFSHATREIFAYFLTPEQFHQVKVEINEKFDELYNQGWEECVENFESTGTDQWNEGYKVGYNDALTFAIEKLKNLK